MAARDPARFDPGFVLQSCQARQRSYRSAGRYELPGIDRDYGRARHQWRILGDCVTPSLGLVVQTRWNLARLEPGICRQLGTAGNAHPEGGK